MLTAVIRVEASAQALAVTLSALIPAVADGFLGHAVVVDAGADSEVEHIAEGTGARYLRAGLTEGWRHGAAQARGEWLLLLDAGDVPQLNWAQVVERHLLVSHSTAGLLPLRGITSALLERAAVSFGPWQLRAGLVAPKPLIMTGRLNGSPLRLAAKRERALG